MRLSSAALENLASALLSNVASAVAQATELLSGQETSPPLAPRLSGAAACLDLGGRLALGGLLFLMALAGGAVASVSEIRERLMSSSRGLRLSFPGSKGIV